MNTMEFLYRLPVGRMVLSAFVFGAVAAFVAYMALKAPTPGSHHLANQSVIIDGLIGVQWLALVTICWVVAAALGLLAMLILVNASILLMDIGKSVIRLTETGIETRRGWLRRRTYSVPFREMGKIGVFKFKGQTWLEI